MLTLTKDVFEYLCKKMGIRDVLRLSQTCKKVYNLILSYKLNNFAIDFYHWPYDYPPPFKCIVWRSGCIDVPSYVTDLYLRQSFNFSHLRLNKLCIDSNSTRSNIEQEHINSVNLDIKHLKCVDMSNTFRSLPSFPNLQTLELCGRWVIKHNFTHLTSLRMNYEVKCVPDMEGVALPPSLEILETPYTLIKGQFFPPRLKKIDLYHCGNHKFDLTHCRRLSDVTFRGTDFKLILPPQVDCGQFEGWGMTLELPAMSKPAMSKIYMDDNQWSGMLPVAKKLSLAMDLDSFSMIPHGVEQLELMYYSDISFRTLPESVTHLKIRGAVSSLTSKEVDGKMIYYYQGMIIPDHVISFNDELFRVKPMWEPFSLD